jgi:hypothetical protein
MVIAYILYSDGQWAVGSANVVLIQYLKTALMLSYSDLQNVYSIEMSCKELTKMMFVEKTDTIFNIADIYI